VRPISPRRRYRFSFGVTFFFTVRVVPAGSLTFTVSRSESLAVRLSTP